MRHRKPSKIPKSRNFGTETSNHDCNAIETVKILRKLPSPAEYVDSCTNGMFSRDQKSAVAKLIADYIDECWLPNDLDYRLASKRFLSLLCAIDEHMSESRNPLRTWREISLALMLPSSQRTASSELMIGQRFGIGKMAVSKSISRFLELANLKPEGRSFANHIKLRI